MGKVESWHASAMASRNHLFYHPFIYLYPDQSSCCCLSLYGEMSSTFGCSFGMSTLKVRGCVSSACAAVEQRGWTWTRTPLHSQAATAELLSAGIQKSCTNFFKTPSLPPSGPKLDLKGAWWIQTKSRMLCIWWKPRSPLVAVTSPNTLTTQAHFRESLLRTEWTHICKTFLWIQSKVPRYSSEEYDTQYLNSHSNSSCLSS